MADVDTLIECNVYSTVMIVEVGVRDLRGNLSSWLDRVQAGDEVIVTERGKPVARLVGVERKTRLQELIEQGRVTPAQRPRTPIDWSKLPKMPPGKTLSDIVIEMREESPY
jgi:prevent-host-death family protein